MAFFDGSKAAAQRSPTNTFERAMQSDHCIGPDKACVCLEQDSLGHAGSKQQRIEQWSLFYLLGIVCCAYVLSEPMSSLAVVLGLLAIVC